MPYFSSRIAHTNGNVLTSDFTDVLISGFARFVKADFALLCQLDGEGRPKPISAVGLTATHLIARGAGRFVSRAPSLQRSVLEPLDPFEDGALIHASQPPLKYAAAAPIRLLEAVGGVLIAGFATAPHDRASTLWAAESYAALLALWLQSPQSLDELAAAARRDGLTGCLTYDAILDELAREINRSARARLDLSVCFVDLDGFKRVNDDHGHLSGNKVLAQVAEILRAGVRSCDAVGRYGGDEFVAILPQTGEPAARRLAERLCALIAAANICSLDHLLTASFGVAGWTIGSSAEELLGRADAALLAAKASHKGVMTASEASAFSAAGLGGSSS